MSVDEEDGTRSGEGLDLPDLMARNALKSMLFSHDRAHRYIDRYRVVRMLGEGGMGMVFRAYDEELSRPVALKVLHEDRHDTGSTGRARLAREAQAMAQLSHPNVVQVHDVGEHEGQVFIAMELVLGQTLADWVDGLGDARTRCHRWKEIVAMFVQAARGLGAAHEVGLVHRDFKPANALVGDDGRLRVLDFGLARARLEGMDEGSPSSDADDTSSSEPADASSSPMPAVLRETMTMAGAVLGTPAYISPEQLMGRRADAASDQFSFCVALHEALFGVRPYVGRTLAAMAVQMRMGGREAIPQGVTVPRWLGAVIERGIAFEHADRWPSMEALIDALLDDPAARRRRRVLAVGALSVFAVGGLGAWVYEQGERARCDAAGEAVLEDWSAARREALRDALVATGSEIAEDTWARTEPRVDAWVDTWSEARARACLDARRGDPEDALREDCLERQRWQLASTLEVLAGADRGVVNQAATMVSELPRAGACDEPGGLAAATMDSESSAEDLERVRHELVRVAVDTRAGRLDQARRRAERSLHDAEALADEALLAEASFRLGAVLGHQGEHAEAEQHLGNAYFLAGSIGYDPIASEAAISLMTTVGRRLMRPGDGHAWSRHARMAMRRMGQDPERASARYFESLGNVHAADGSYREATEIYARAMERHQELYGQEHPGIIPILGDSSNSHLLLGQLDRAAELNQQALDLAVRTLGDGHPEVAVLLNNQGMLEQQRGRSAEAIMLYQRALQIQQAVLGAHSPQVASTLGQLGISLRTQGKFGEAIEAFEQALRTAEASLGPQHPDMATYHTHLGFTRGMMGQLDAALKHQLESLAILERALGDEHADLINALHGVGNILQRRGRHEESLTYLRRELTLRERSVGSEHPDVAIILDGIGHSLRCLGELDEAMTLHQRGLAIRERTLPAEHRGIASSHEYIGYAQRELGLLDEAIASHRKALAISEVAVGPEQLFTADTMRPLGRALGEAGEHDEALEILQRARSVYEQAEGGTDVDVAVTLLEVGRVQLEAGRPEATVANLRKAIELWGGEPDDPFQLLDARFVLARALWAEAERDEALEMASGLDEPLAALGRAGERLRDEVAAWRRQPRTEPSTRAEVRERVR